MSTSYLLPATTPYDTTAMVDDEEDPSNLKPVGGLQPARPMRANTTLANGTNIGTSMAIGPQGAYSWMQGQNAATGGQTLQSSSSSEVQPLQPAQPMSSTPPAATTGPSQQLQPAQPKRHGVWDHIGNLFVPGAMEAFPSTSLGALHQQQIKTAQDQASAQLADTQQQTEQRRQQAVLDAAKATGMAPVMVTPEMHAANPALVVGTTIRPADYGNTLKAQTQNTGKVDVANVNKDAKEDVAQLNNDALTDVRTATENLKKAQADALNADPNTPAGKMAIAKLRAAESGHTASLLGAQARMISARGGYMGTDENGRPLNGIGETADGTPIGTHLQGAYTKNAGNIGVYQDIYSSIDNANAAIDDGDKVGAKFNTAKMAEALSDPKTTVAQWVAGKVNTTLTPQERNIVISTKALREQLQGLRGTLKTGTAMAQVDRMIDQLPNATTPDMAYARKQLATVRGQMDRLQVGFPKVNNGPALQAPESPAAPTVRGGVPSSIPTAGRDPNMIYARDPQGRLHAAPKAGAKPLPQGWKYDTGGR